MDQQEEGNVLAQHQPMNMQATDTQIRGLANYDVEGRLP